MARLAGLTLVGLLSPATPGLAANDRIIFQKELSLWTADANGENQREVIARGPEDSIGQADLSPNGGTAVVRDAPRGGLALVNVVTGTIKVIPNTAEASHPKFSPDESKVVFSLEGDVASINVDGTGFKKIITWKGSQGEPDFSPDGTKIAFSSSTNPKGQPLTGGMQVFIANANGTSPVQVTKDTAGVVQGSDAPMFSPSGTMLAFTGYASEKLIYTVSTSGTNQTPITAKDGDVPDWSPDGSTIIFGTHRNKGLFGSDLYTVNSTGGNEQPFITDPKLSVENGWYRHPSTTVHFFDYLAAKYEPVLRFDTSESWRPLNVEAFFAEKQHHLCEEGGSCQSEALSSSVGLNANRSSKAYIDIAGTRPSEGGGAGTYHSPYSECTVNRLRDCNAGPKSAIYYRSPGVIGGYEYIDYWYFYRANYFLEGVDFHEGDWEGATVAPSLTGDSFDYAGFSQHGTYYSYLRNVLRCEDSPAGSLPERGTCGTTSARIDDLVSNGDHANYTTPCKEELPTSCQQNGEGHFEAGYDGTQRWGRAYDEPATSLLLMPTVGTSGWVDWPGKWGSPAGSFEEGSGPPSPGNQTFKIECASIDNEPGCTPGPRTASVRNPSAPISDGVTSVPGLTAVSCSSWAGPGVAAAACNPKELYQAVVSGHVGTTGGMTIAAAGTPGRGASGRGIAQYAGGVLSPGAQLRVSGPVTKETEVLVRVYDAAHRHILLGRFKLGAQTDKAVAHAAGLRLLLRVGRTRHGHVLLSLGRIHAQRVAIVR